MKLTLWTTPELKDIILNFYVKFIKEIEKFIMGCENWEQIKDLLESLIDNGEFKFGRYMKYIDVSKKRKNIKLKKHFDKKNNGYKLILIEDMDDVEIDEWCKDAALPCYVYINDIRKMDKDEFIEKYGDSEIKFEVFESLDECNNWCEENYMKPPDNDWISERERNKEGDIYRENVGFREHNWKKMYVDEITNNKNAFRDARKRRFYRAYNKNNKPNVVIRYDTNKKVLPKQTNKYIKKTPYIVDGVKVKYSVLKEEYTQKNSHGYTNDNEDNFIVDDGGLPDKYYWKTPDGWLYLHDKNRPDIISLDVVAPSTPSEPAPLINDDVLLFTKSCCGKPDKKNLRLGLKPIYTKYKAWCKTNIKRCLKTQKKFREEFEKIGYELEKGKGVDVDGNPGKRGYNLLLSA